MSRKPKHVEDDWIQTELEQLEIDDSRVNKMRRRRSVRIQKQIERRRTLDFSLDLLNNNLPVINNNNNVTVQTQSRIEFELELENIHYQRAIQQFEYITNNEFLIRRKKNKADDDSSACDCILTAKQISSGVLGCAAKCLNRSMYIECNGNCALGKYCSNRQFQKQQNARCTVFITEKKGYGLFASTHIPTNGTFIMEFVGEIVSMSEFKKRSNAYVKQKLRHCYVMTSSGRNLIDATRKGNLTRFINHSCDPNAETQKWTINGECRIGIFTRRSIKAFEEITINYQFERFG